MRIRGSGSGFGEFGGRDSRSDSFRKKHQIGQKIRGTLLKNLDDSMAWVSIDGDKLLAQLQRIHPEGSRLTFIIKQLTPDIILKEIFESSAGGTGALDLVNAFETARTLFENEFRTVRTTETCNTANRLNFLRLCAIHSKLSVLFRDAANCATAISTGLEKTGKGQILYQPWLASNGRRQITHVLLPRNKDKNALSRSTVEYEHDIWGLVRTEFLYKPPTAGFKIKLQRPEYAQALASHLSAISQKDMNLEMECLGVERLPRQHHGGVLAQLLFRPSQ